MIDTRIETKHIIAELSVTEKVCLYNALYKDLASKGIGGDTELAHVNMAEMAVLRDMGGSGTINPDTGLIQFMGGGSPPSQPSNTTQSQTSEFPDELKPYITDVLSKSQAIQEKREADGYKAYEGPQIAEFTPEQEQAFTGIQGMVGQGQKYFDPSAQLAASSARAVTDEEISGYMSPYMQQVVDIQKREAERQGDVSQQKLASQAVGSGGFGGSRTAILEAEQSRNMQTQLGDIQARGTAAAYEDAQARLAAQRQRELQGSTQFMNLGTTAPQQQLKELTAVEAVGAQKQAQAQQALNIAKNEFEQEQTFDERTLQQYQSVIRGFPLAPSTYTNTQTVNPAPSYLQQFAGLGGLGLGVAGAFGGFGRAEGGLVSRMHGGPVDQNRGLGSIVVKRQAGTLVDLSIEELEKFANDYRVPGRQRVEAIEILKQRKNKAGMPLEQEPIPKELGRSPLSVSPAEARIAAQERKMGLSMADQPTTDKSGIVKHIENIPLVKDILNPAGRFLNKEVYPRIGGVVGDIGSSIYNLSGKVTDYTTGSETPRINISDTLGLPSPLLGNKEDVSSSVTLDLKPPPSTTPEAVTMYGQGDVGDMLSEERSRIAAALPKQSAATAPATEEAVTMYGSKGNVGDIFGSEQLTTENNVVGIKTEAIKTISNSSPLETSDGKGSEIRNKMLAEMKTLSTKRKDSLSQREKGLDSDRWLAVANLGASILAQPGGTTFLQAVGKGAKDSGILTTLSKLNREERDIADKLDTIDLETLTQEYGLSKDEAAAFARERSYGLKIKELNLREEIANKELLAATTKADRLAANNAKKAAQTRKKLILDATKRLTEPQQTVWDKQYTSIVKDLMTNPKTGLTPAVKAKFQTDFWDSKAGISANNNLKEEFRGELNLLKIDKPNLTGLQRQREAFTKVYGSYLR
jgi:hypothetical protein